MSKPRNAVYVIVAACSLALAACQPAEESSARSARSLDTDAGKIVAQIDKPADIARDTADGAKP